MTENQESEPFGHTWHKEMMSMNKKDIVGLLEVALKKNIENERFLYPPMDEKPLVEPPDSELPFDKNGEAK